MTKKFDDAMAIGRLGEELVTAWMQRRGAGVIPSYAASIDAKAPKMLFSSSSLVLPDLDVCSFGHRFWVEVKTYRGPARNRKRGCYVHGFDRRLHMQYLDVARTSGCPVLLTVVEVMSGALLAAPLETLSVWGCECAGCQDEDECIADRHIYFRRDDMRILDMLDDSTMEPIRLKWGDVNQPPLRRLG